MKKFLLAAVLLLVVFANGFAQCTEPSQRKVLLIGDSWASFMNIDQTFNTALKNWGHSGYKFTSNSTVAENGAETDDFLKPAKLSAIKQLLAQNPSIEVIHVSIGGNDYLGTWKVSFTAGQTDTLFSEVKGRLLAIFDSLKSFKPGIQIVWSGYCYPNFDEVINTSSLGNSHPFYGTWEDMEFPTFLQLNSLLNRVSDSVEAYAAADPQLHFIKATGLLQHIYGQPTPLGVAPGGSFAPGTVPLPYGDPAYPSNRNTMRDYFLTKDCFHLSPQAYIDLIEYHTQKFYHKFLMDDFYALSETANTGTVSSAGTTSATLQVGESGGEQLAAVVSFNTSGMADTGLANASLFLRRESLTGTNPINGSLELKIKSGNFGASATVEAADFSATADATGSPCLFGVSNADKKWFRLDLPASFLPYITGNAPVQLSISAGSGFTGGVVTLSNAADPDFAPVLNLVYQAPGVAVEDVTESAITVTVYPNPANNMLFVEAGNAQVQQIEITDLTGRVVAQSNGAATGINVSALAAGNYLVKLHTTKGLAVRQFVKE